MIRDLPFQHTLEETERVIFGAEPSVDDFYRENSGGLTWLSGIVLGPYYLGEHMPWGQPSEVANSLLSAADPYVDFTQYKRIIFVIGFFCGYGEVGAGVHVTPDGEVTQ